MNENEAQTPEMRAAEYVLGSLDANEHAKVESELAENSALQREVAYWEQRLGHLSLLQAPVEPPAQVWSQIQARTVARAVTQPQAHAQSQAQAAANDAPQKQPSSGLWIGFAVAASMAAFALATALFVGLQSDSVNPPGPVLTQTAAPVYASFIEDEKRNLAWLVTADSSPAQHLQVVAMGESYGETWADRSLELWLLAPGENPISLGLLPKEGVSNIPLPADVASKLAQAGNKDKPTKLAVSNEPLGGSPSGAPTGEVLFVVAVNQRES